MGFATHSARQAIRSFALALTLAIVPVGSVRGQETSASNGEHIHWKAVEQAQVKLDDKTPLGWNIFQPDKKDKKSIKKGSNLVLLLLGHRYLMLDTEARLVYEVPVVSLQAHGPDFESEDPPVNAHLVPSTDWILRDVGPAELIRLTLGDYGRSLEVSIPHPPDMRPFY